MKVAFVIALSIWAPVTKPTKWVCSQRRLRSAWASAQPDQSLRCPHEESLDPELPNERTAKTLIRLGGCPGWSESSLGAQAHCWFCHEAAHIAMRPVLKCTTHGIISRILLFDSHVIESTTGTTVICYFIFLSMTESCLMPSKKRLLWNRIPEI